MTRSENTADVAMTLNEGLQYLLGSGGRAPSLPTVYRWMSVGVIGPTGERVRLGSVRIGGRRLVRKSQLDAFVAALNGEPSSAGATAAQLDAHKGMAAARRLAEQGVR